MNLQQTDNCSTTAVKSWPGDWECEVLDWPSPEESKGVSSSQCSKHGQLGECGSSQEGAFV